MTTNTKRLIGALAFFIWTAFVVAAFYVVQKPALMAGISGIADTAWSLIIWALLVINGTGIGNFLLRQIPRLPIHAVERLLISAGIGLGLLGLAGFLLGLLGLVHPGLLISIQVGVFLLLWWQKYLHTILDDLRQFVFHWRISMTTTPLWIKIAMGVTFLFAFLMALAPPGEAFDALFYHLPRTERILNGTGLQPSSVPHFWFPALPEDVFLWAQGMGSVRATQLLHLTWAILGILLLWYWAAKVWDIKTAQASLIIIISMPSLYLLASWAYTDFALTFYGLTTIYGIYKAHENDGEYPSTGWVIIAGIAAGMAMGVKYTSFMVPVTGVLLLIWWQRRKPGTALKLSLTFGGIALLIAAPWYLRSWAVMGNPFYPFVFGGKYWDAFRADWYAQSGSGIGWDIFELLLLPFNATLGHRDANYYDGRIGPLYLILAPLTLWVLFATRQSFRQQGKTLIAITLFAVLSMVAWGFGVINSSALWQTRLLYPALIPFALPTALGWLAVKKLDTPHLRISFIFNFVVIAIVTITLIDAGRSVIMRNPLAYAVGAETQESYLAKVQPSYAQAVELIQDSPEDAKIYALYEPRNYYMPRDIQPDPILDNFAHDVFLYGDPNEVLASWQDEGYTHVLIYRHGIDFLIENDARRLSPQHLSALDYLQNKLIFVGSTADGSYELYAIHSKE
jgi:hypothetical protein